MRRHASSSGICCWLLTTCYTRDLCFDRLFRCSLYLSNILLTPSTLHTSMLTFPRSWCLSFAWDIICMTLPFRVESWYLSLLLWWLGCSALCALLLLLTLLLGSQRFEIADVCIDLCLWHLYCAWALRGTVLSAGHLGCYLLLLMVASVCMLFKGLDSSAHHTCWALVCGY